MSIRLKVSHEFRGELKRLVRKFPLLAEDLDDLGARLKQGDIPGDKVTGVGYNVFKVRLPNRSARRGKSGGFRVIYYVVMADEVLLVTIYSKTEQSDVDLDRIRRIIDQHQ